MRKEHLKMGIPTAWVLSVALFLNFLAIIIWGVTHLDMALIFLYLALNTMLLIILVNDIYLSPIREKWFWMFSMFVLLPVASITYLAKRKSLIIKN